MVRDRQPFDADVAAARSVRTLAGLAMRISRAWWRSLLPLAASTAILAVVIGGAIGVGESVHRGLLSRATARLGRIGAAVLAERPFHDSLAVRSAADGLPAGIERLVPAFVIDVSAEAAGGERRRSRTGLLACRDPSELGWAWNTGPLPADSVAVNDVLASRLGVVAGDSIVLRTVARSPVAIDSPLGRRDADPLSRRVRVAAVMSPEGIGRFSLSPSQVDRPLVVAPLELAGRLLKEPDRANVILAVLREDAATADASRLAAGWLEEHLHPTAADLGIDVRKDERGVVRVSSSSLVLTPELDRATAAVLGPLGGTASLVLLANAIRTESGGTIPYSTVAGCSTPALPFGSLESVEGALIAPIERGRVVINRWMAEDLARQGHPVSRGSPLRLEWFAPETLHGRVEERSRVLTVSDVVDMQGAALERSLVPDVEGVTDEASIADWDPPFPFDASRVRSSPPDDADDRYWKAYGATPKAFIALEEARDMGAGRFGRTTAWHCRVSDDVTADQIARNIADQITPSRAGFTTRPLLAEAVEASRGSTPFGGLFTALSMYLVVAGLALAWLLASLLVTGHRRDVGILAALGWTGRRVATLVWGVMGIAAACGAVVGAMLGPTWACVLIAWLSRSWAGLAGAPSDATLGDPAIGPLGIALIALVGFLLAMLAAGLNALRSAGEGVRGLLEGADPSRRRITSGRTRRADRWRWIGTAGLVASCVLVALGWSVGDEATVFFVAATLALAGWLVLARSCLVPLPVRSLTGLVWSGVVESPARSFAVVTIVALAEFLIVAVSAFAFREPVDPDDVTGPTGGYSIVSTLAAPSGLDLKDPTVLSSAGLADEAASAVSAATIVPLRATDGDDASCLNLYRARAPVIVGVDAFFRARGGFRFTSTAGHADLGSAWELLAHPTGETPAVPPVDPGRVPVILDESTARYALGLSGIGATIDVTDGNGMPRKLEVVGLLAPGILQGMLIVAEERFTELYPLVSGYRMLLVDCRDRPAAGAADTDAIGTMFADNGVETVGTLDRLRMLGAVQNIYLAGFQSLGVLGMILGTAGVAVTRLRSVLERQSVFALMLAIGFTPGRVRLLVLAETLVLVLTGLATGAVSGTLAVLAQLASGRAALPAGWLAISVGLTCAAAIAAGVFVAGRSVVRRPISFLGAS